MIAAENKSGQFKHVQTSSPVGIFSVGDCKNRLNKIKHFCAVRSGKDVKTAPCGIKNIAARVQTKNGPASDANREQGLTPSDERIARG